MSLTFVSNSLTSTAASISPPWFSVRLRGGRRRAPAPLASCFGSLPLGPALLEPAGLASGVAQAPHCVMGVRAERPAAVGHDFLIRRELGEAALQFIERDRAGALDVTRIEFFRRANVDQHHVTAPQPSPQLLAPDALDLLAEIGARGPLNLAELCRGRIAQGKPDVQGLIARQRVPHPRSLALTRDQPGRV